MREKQIPTAVQIAAKMKAKRHFDLSTRMKIKLRNVASWRYLKIRWAIRDSSSQ